MVHHTYHTVTKIHKFHMDITHVQYDIFTGIMQMCLNKSSM